MSTITIYTTPTCGYCKMAKAFFKKHNVQYTEKDVTSDERFVQEMAQKSGQTGVPVIEVDGEIVVGFDRGALTRLLGIA